MEYLTDLITTVPEGTSPVKVDELRAAEAVRAAELTKAGHLVRLWRPPLGPGEWLHLASSTKNMHMQQPVRRMNTRMFPQTYLRLRYP